MSVFANILDFGYDFPCNGEPIPAIVLPAGWSYAGVPTFATDSQTIVVLARIPAPIYAPCFDLL